MYYSILNLAKIPKIFTTRKYNAKKMQEIETERIPNPWKERIG
jgi:hypothetical protein